MQVDAYDVNKDVTDFDGELDVALMVTIPFMLRTPKRQTDRDKGLEEIL